MSCEQSECSEEPDGKFAARNDTRWIKHGFNGDAEFRGEYATARLEQREGHPVVPKIEVMPVRNENEVTLVMSIDSTDDPPHDLHSGVLATFTADQIFALADALEETAGAARDGELADSLER
jgi:hypothetical protein